MQFFFKGNKTNEDASFSNCSINESDIPEDALNKVTFFIKYKLFI